MYRVPTVDSKGNRFLHHRVFKPMLKGTADVLEGKRTITNSEFLENSAIRRYKTGHKENYLLYPDL